MRLVGIILATLFISLDISLYGQDVISIPERTPVQEATRQTERMEKELGLSPEQTKKVYEINLKYAREKQKSNSRSEAIERGRNKDAELQRVLNQEQINILQNKRFEYRNSQSNNSKYIPNNAYRAIPRSEEKSSTRTSNPSNKNERPPVNPNRPTGKGNSH